eukprot:TRINITY_DN60969_c0_g1_i1.p1 TRINITY_DN60969_c0_g1~~TRINITY_DN60969_c0_g1_i1.p1  ORF type:complete len:204 (+),score=20.28 TRINITY_DN60969_c0_g1_i1:154-765(+)
MSGSFAERMMASMGWDGKSGLGSSQQGITTSLETRRREAGSGLGSNADPEVLIRTKADAAASYHALFSRLKATGGTTTKTSGDSEDAKDKHSSDDKERRRRERRERREREAAGGKDADVRGKKRERSPDAGSDDASRRKDRRKDRKRGEDGSAKSSKTAEPAPAAKAMVSRRGFVFHRRLQDKLSATSAEQAAKLAVILQGGV